MFPHTIGTASDDAAHGAPGDWTTWLCTEERDVKTLVRTQTNARPTTVLLRNGGKGANNKRLKRWDGELSAWRGRTEILDAQLQAVVLLSK